MIESETRIDGMPRKNSYTESYILKGDKLLISLITPDVLRKNEPNEIFIEIDAGNFSHI